MNDYDEYGASSFEPSVNDLLADYDAYLYSLTDEGKEEEEAAFLKRKSDRENKDSLDSISSKVQPRRESLIEDIHVNDEHFVGIIRVDKSTGEIIARYEVVPVKQMTQSEYDREYKIIPSPINARNNDHIEDYIKLQRKNKSKITKRNDLLKFVEESAGKRRYGDKNQPNITKPTLNVLIALCNAVKIHNVIVGTRAEVAELLGVKENHLQRKLKMVADHIRVYDEKQGMNTGFIKIAVTPHFVFAGAGNMLYQQREAAMKDWYVNKQRVYAEHIEWLMQPSERVDYSDYKFSEDFESYLKNYSSKRKFYI